MQLPLIRQLNLSNRWHRLGLYAAGLFIGFMALLWFTRPDHTPAPTLLSVVPQAAPRAVAPEPAAPQNAQLILELFNPGDASLTHQLSTSALEQQIEQATTTSFVLRKCELLSREEYRDVFRALILYAQQTHLVADAAGAEAEVRRISDSAGTSYALIYSRTKCDDDQLPGLAYQLKSWTQLILTQSSARP